MSLPAEPKDLVVLVPGRDEEQALMAVLSRPGAIGIRSIRWELQRHPDRDSGCRQDAHDFLRRESDRFSHALVLFDRQGSGAEHLTREELEESVEKRLSGTGWGNRAGVVVVDPELEVLVWSESPHVDRCLGWEGRDPDLRTWLRSEGYWPGGVAKPPDPKRAMEVAMYLVRKRRSSSIYKQLAGTVSFHRCSDPAFAKLLTLLRDWFGQSPNE